MQYGRTPAMPYVRKSSRKPVMRPQPPATHRDSAPPAPRPQYETPAEPVAPKGPPAADLDVAALQQASFAELTRLAAEAGVELTEPSKQDLIIHLARAHARRGATLRSAGVLELMPDNFGFLRTAAANYLTSPLDVYVSPAQVRRFGLRAGMTVRGTIRPALEGQTSFGLLQVEQVDGAAPEEVARRVLFEDLLPLHPDERLKLENGADDVNMRVVDLVTPIGKGQRGLIVAPPRTGKTILLQKMAGSVLKNHPECHVIMLLIDERPEEVTEMRRHVGGPNAEVVSSTFDAPASDHIRVAEVVIERARRLVEGGKDVVLFLDSITRLARAYNAETHSNNRTMSGGIEAGALARPKRFFGAARNLEEGGSLTILATALVDTGSRMDEVIFEEFKGTGNMELHLDRKLVDKRVWPAIDVNASGTRREELLLSAEDLARVHLLRRALGDMHPVEAMELIVKRMRKTKTNAEFLRTMHLG